MTAIKIDSLKSNNRHRLQDVVPLRTPYKVNIEPTNLCNIGCKFCPTSDHALVRSVRPQGVMPFDLFRKIVDDLGEFPDKIKLTELYQDGEPLINKNFPDMTNDLESTNQTKLAKRKHKKQSIGLSRKEK